MFRGFKQSLAVWIIRRIQKYGPHRVEVLGRSYEISREVFNPKFYYTSEFLAKHIRVGPEDEVLDIGTGSGIQAITAGQAARRVIAVDINGKAVQCAGRNVTANRMENVVSLVQGNLFAPLNPRHKFNVILFTPPYFDGVPKTDFEHAIFDPDKELARKFFREAKEYLTPGGYVKMVYSSIAEPGIVLAIANEFGWKYTLTAREETLLERFLLYRLTLNQESRQQSRGFPVINSH